MGKMLTLPPGLWDESMQIKYAGQCPFKISKIKLFHVYFHTLNCSTCSPRIKAFWGTPLASADKWVVCKRNCLVTFRQAANSCPAHRTSFSWVRCCCFLAFLQRRFSSFRNTGFYNISWCLSTCWVLVCLILFFIKSKDLHVIGFPSGSGAHLWSAATIRTEHPHKGGFASFHFFFLLFYFFNNPWRLTSGHWFTSFSTIIFIALFLSLRVTCSLKNVWQKNNNNTHLFPTIYWALIICKTLIKLSAS